MKGEIAVRYTIRHFDLPLLTFEANMDSADTGLHFIKVYEENRSFLPLNLTVSEDGVERWLRHRTIPKQQHTNFACVLPGVLDQRDAAKMLAQTKRKNLSL